MWEYYFCKFAADPLRLRQSTTTSPTMKIASRNRVRRNSCARARRGGNLPRTVFTVIPFGIILLQRGKLRAPTAIRKEKTPPPTGKSEGLERKGKKIKRARWKNRWVTRRNPKVVLARILVSSLVKRKVVEEEGGLREVETGGGVAERGKEKGVVARGCKLRHFSLR